MTLKLFFDTETTGLPLFKEPSEDPRQPHIVQLAAQLINVDTRVVVSSIDFIIKPDGWEIPAEASEVHGITTEMAMDLGIAEDLAVDAMLALWANAGERVGHNEPFDARILRIAIKRLLHDDELAETWKAGPAACTARLSTPIVKLPPTPAMVAKNMRFHKTPDLAEAYEFFTGNKLEGAHSAMVDVNACATVWFGVQDYAAAQIAAAAGNESAVPA